MIVHDLYALESSLTILFPLERSGVPAPLCSINAHDVSLENFCLSFQQWYNSSMSVICTWLTDRMDLQLHIYQLKTLIRMVKVKEKHSSSLQIAY